MLSKKVASMAMSATLAIDAQAKKMKAAGEDVLLFTVGEPDLLPPAHVTAAAIEAFNAHDASFWHYTSSSGNAELKAVIVEKFARENKIHYNPDQVIVTNGAKEALFLAFQALLNDGDEVIIPTPCWVSTKQQVWAAGGVPVMLPTDETFHFTAKDIAAALTPKTKIIALNSPCNPTGAVIAPTELATIAQLAVQHNLMIISDEVYEHFIYGDHKHVSPASLNIPEISNHVITINSGSKTYAITGLRVGYAAGPSVVIAAMTRLKSHVSSNTSNIAQRALLAALRGPQDFVQQMRQIFFKRCELLYVGINKIRGCVLAKPEGAFYGFINVAGLMREKGITSSADFCARLLNEQKVALTPGQPFGEAYDTYVRFSFAAATDDIKQALERIAEFAISRQL